MNLNEHLIERASNCMVYTQCCQHTLPSFSYFERLEEEGSLLRQFNLEWDSAFKSKTAHTSFVKLQPVIQLDWDGASESAFLICYQVMVKLHSAHHAK